MSGVKGKSGRKSGEGVFTVRKKTLKNPKKFFGYKVEDYEYEEMRSNLNEYIKENNLKSTTEALKKIFLEVIKCK